uniref:DsbA family protein n=1 Tax=Marinobacterium profundum TaxID=1714300 RepID=UPI00082CF13D|nr:thioredoxin domain-containing protein [Marinobacterium profundum]
MKRRTLVAGTAALAVAAFAGGTYILNNQQQSKLATAAAAGDLLVRPHSPTLGPAGAPVTIVEFFDPSCEACRAFYPLVKQIMWRFPGQVRVVLRYAALHKGSDEAVKIIEAARLQNVFEPVLEALLDAQPTWAKHEGPDLAKAWDAAASAGLDIEKAKGDLNSPAILDALNQDTADLQALGISKTPTFFVNGQPLVDFGPQGLLELVQNEIEKS